jgi:hypothetical protein
LLPCRLAVALLHRENCISRPCGYVVDRQVRLQFMLGRPVPEGSLLDDLR